MISWSFTNMILRKERPSVTIYYLGETNHSKSGKRRKKKKKLGVYVLCILLFVGIVGVARAGVIMVGF